MGLVWRKWTSLVGQPIGLVRLVRVLRAQFILPAERRSGGRIPQVVLLAT